MRIAGLDVASKLGAAVLDFKGSGPGRVVQVEKIKAPTKLRGMERCSVLGFAVDQLLQQHRPDLVMIEDYGMTYRGSGMVSMEIGTVVRYFVWQEGFCYEEVPPKSLKVFTTNDGNAGKPKMIEAVKRLWGFDAGNDDDIADAVALAHFGACWQGFDVKIPSGHLRAFDKFTPKKK